MDEQARAEWVTLGLLPHVGGKLFRNLLKVFETPHQVLAASYDDLRAVAGVGPKIAKMLIHAHQDVDKTRKQLATWEKADVSALLWPDERYPTALQTLSDAPPVLFVRGHWENPPLKSVALVGTRAPSENAERLTRDLAHQLASDGWTVASGLAMGVDRAAHFGALDANSAACPTVAFMGNGLLRLYPPDNLKLAQKILAKGAIFAEVSPHSPPSTPALVARNRLISGFSRAVVVVETGDPGGAMHTARFATDQQRPIYTFDFAMAGNHRLMQAGHLCLPPTQEGISALLEQLGRL